MKKINVIPMPYWHCSIKYSDNLITVPNPDCCDEVLSFGVDTTKMSKTDIIRYVSKELNRQLGLGLNI